MRTWAQTGKISIYNPAVLLCKFIFFCVCLLSLCNSLLFLFSVFVAVLCLLVFFLSLSVFSHFSFLVLCMSHHHFVIIFCFLLLFCFHLQSSFVYLWWSCLFIIVLCLFFWKSPGAPGPEPGRPIQWSVQSLQGHTLLFSAFWKSRCFPVWPTTPIWHQHSLKWT